MLRVLKALFWFIAAWIAQPLIKFRFRDRKIWLIGEKTGEYLEDNGFYFFDYCLANDTGSECFFVVQPERTNALRARFPAKRLIAYGSFQHILLLMHADALFYTHTHRDLIYNSLLRCLPARSCKIFLQHGVSGFKRFNADYILNSGLPDIVVAVSEFERSVLSEAGFDPRRIKVTGFPRHDYLQNLLPAQSRQIAYLPTWRDWLDPQSFPGSPFERHIQDLIKSQALADLLARENIILKLYLHVNMRFFSPHFSSSQPNIQVIPHGSEPVKALISQSLALITDYSSVSWDFLFLGKPVIFYQFDVVEYLRERGSYLDFGTHAFGDVVMSEKELLRAIQKLIDHDFKLDEKSARMRDSCFDHFDRLSCRRLAEAVRICSTHTVPEADET